MAVCTCGRGVRTVACKKHPESAATPIQTIVSAAGISAQPAPQALGGYLLESTRSVSFRSFTVRHKGGGTMDWCLKTSLDDGTKIYYYGYARSLPECLDAADRAIYTGNWRYDKQ